MFVVLVTAVDSANILGSHIIGPKNPFIATNKDNAQGSDHLWQGGQQQSARPKGNMKSQSKKQTLDVNSTNGIEYNFDINNNYEVKSGDHIINVKGDFKNEVCFSGNLFYRQMIFILNAI